MKKYSKLLLLLLAITTLVSLWKFPTGTPILGISLLLFSLTIALHGIVEKYKNTENSRIKIAKDVLIFTTSFLLISFLGGVAGLLTNHYVSVSFGTMAGFVCAMLAGIIVGYCVRWGTGKLIR
ncbi:MAG: hypothetical protein JNM46_03160 [Anaerolineales bacterium]|nr:hypothetical protein [Anaerolineales bacterium]